MRRREFMTLLFGGLLPNVALAQSSPARLGFLGTGSPSLSGVFVDALRKGLRENTLQEGRDYIFDFAWAEGRYERFPELAKQMVERHPALIFATTIAAVKAAQQATSTTPIIMTSINDPIGAGLVKSLSRPGGNTTGVASLAEDVTTKFVEMLRETVPGARSAAVVGNSGNPSNSRMFDKLSKILQGKSVSRIDIANPDDIAQRFIFGAGDKPDVVFILPDFMLIDNRVAICKQALAQKIPTITNVPEYGEAGVLISYGSPRRENYRRSAHFVKRIFEGASPSTLPIEQPNLIQMAINMRTAQEIGISISPSLLARADEVIE